MKGFIYLLEIAVASILMVVVLSTFFAIRVKQNWDAPDLVATGNNLMKYISKDDTALLSILDEDFSEMIEEIKPVNIGYGLRVKGSPKTNIIVGCTQPLFLDYIKNTLLTQAYVNGRYINFDVQEFDIDEGIPDFYDAVVLVNFTGYSSYKTAIANYLNQGRTVIGINATRQSNNGDFNEIFGLTPDGSVGGLNTFTEYDPDSEDIEKYFLGIGFDVKTEWYIWEDRWRIFYVGSNINISKPDGSDFRLVGEGGTFNLPDPNSNSYSFKVNKIVPGVSANIQPLDSDFVFRDFSDTNDVMTDNKIVGPAEAASMASKGNAIWISDFPRSDEYDSLVKAAILSRNDDWIARGVYTTKETSTVSSFFSLCCDMPETAELEITLWYVI